MSDVLDILDKLTTAVSFQFKQDGTKPNVTISKLKNSYYGSVVRYPGKEKKVVCKAESPTLAELIPNLAKAFLIVTKSPPDPLQQLSALVGNTVDDDSGDVVGRVDYPPTGFIKYGDSRDEQITMTGRTFQSLLGRSI